MGAGAPTSYVGKLLLAPAGVDDRPFAQAVILVVDREESGITLGVVLNRPTERRVIEAWAMALFFLENVQEASYWGGPMGTDALILAEIDQQQGLEWFHTGVEHRRPFPLPNVTLVALGEHPDALEGRIRRGRLYTGLCVWGRHQLEHEVERGEWLVREASTQDVFTNEPAELWERVARRPDPGA